MTTTIPNPQLLTHQLGLAGGLLALVGLVVFDLPGGRNPLRPQAAPSVPSESCTRIVQGEATLSREQLAQLLTIPERDPKERVRAVVAEPYCELPSLEVRSGVEAHREAYPLAFDPHIHLVILYENDEYAGYRFKFNGATR